MSYKILTKNGVDNSNIDGARGEYFNTGMRNGIVQGVLNEGVFIASSSNTISLDTCELRIAGHRVVIDEPVYYTFSNIPNTDTQYSFIAEIVVEASGNVSFSLFPQLSTTELIQNDLYKTINGIGTYQVEIGRCTLLTDGTITDVVRTIDIITGSLSNNSNVEIGNVTTNKIDYELDTEININLRYDEDTKKEYVDVDIQLPIDLSSVLDSLATKEEVNDIVGNINILLDNINGEVI